jgi:hypothetical protein
MTRHVLLLVVCLAVLGGSGFAQQPPKPPSSPASPAAPRVPQAPRAPSVPGAPQPPNAPAAPPAVDESAGGQPVNIRVEVAINDQVGGTISPPKTMTLLLADRSRNQVRSGFDDRTLNIDARPTIVDGRVRLSINIQSEPLSKTPADSFASMNMRQTQNITVMLDNGKPLVIFENADPTSKRKLTIEVKATILK